MTIEAIMEHLEDKSQEEINEILEELKQQRSKPAIAREVLGGEYIGLYEINRITEEMKSEVDDFVLGQCNEPPFVVRLITCSSSSESLEVIFRAGQGSGKNGIILGRVEADTYHGALKKLGYKVESLDDEVVG